MLKILLTGSTGGMGTAIKKRLKDHELTCIGRPIGEITGEFDWIICAHGVLNESNVTETFFANVISNIHLAQDVKGKIIFISSTSGIGGNDAYPVYSASKAALNMYAKLIARTRNCYVICPGATDTPMFRKLKIDIKPQDPSVIAELVVKIMDGEFKSGDVIVIKNGEII